MSLGSLSSALTSSLSSKVADTVSLGTEIASYESFDVNEILSKGMEKMTQKVTQKLLTPEAGEGDAESMREPEYVKLL